MSVFSKTFELRMRLGRHRAMAKWRACPPRFRPLPEGIAVRLVDQAASAFAHDAYHFGTLMQRRDEQRRRCGAAMSIYPRRFSRAPRRAPLPHGLSFRLMTHS